MTWFGRHPFWTLFGVYLAVAVGDAFTMLQDYTEPFLFVVGVSWISWAFAYITALAVALAVDRKWPDQTLVTGVVVFAVLVVIARSSLV